MCNGKSNTMSMNVILYPCEYKPIDSAPGFDRYYSQVKFELDSWCTWVLKDITENSKLINLPVHISWVNRMEIRYPYPMENCFDPDCTFLVDAWVVKTMKFHRDEWHIQRAIRSKAISAYLNELPDDWPVIVYYV